MNLCELSVPYQNLWHILLISSFLKRYNTDDTGCPTSKSVTPSKTPSGSEQSTHSSPVLPERTTKVKRVRVVAEPRPRHKRELSSAMKHRSKSNSKEIFDNLFNIRSRFIFKEKLPPCQRLTSASDKFQKHLGGSAWRTKGHEREGHVGGVWVVIDIWLIR